MKTRVFNIALAVVAAAIASSCIQEKMEPQGDQHLQIVGQAFQANHEEITKSTLINLTPTWVDGDVIKVSGANGVVDCSFVSDNTFHTGDEAVELQSPFYAIYPAEGNSVNRETGVFTVTVPAEQVVKADQNVAPGALVAVAASETNELSFKNVVGLVKLNIRRNDITKVVIKTTEYENIAGTCTVDLNPDKENEGEDPAITLVKDHAKNQIILTYEEGAFPAGEYYATIYPRTISGIEVTFYRMNGETEESKMVRKAGQTEVVRNCGIDLGEFFVYEISTAEELLAWNKASAKWTAWDVVTLTANIDCKDVINSENWNPTQFGGVFDGKGNTIDNFVIEKAGTAAFFSKLQDATVENLVFGEGCSFTSTAATVDKVYAASLAGEMRGGSVVKNVENHGAVSIDAEATTGTGGDHLGGICAYFLADSPSEMNGCKNYGTLTYSAIPTGPVYCGGITGLSATNKGLKLTACENFGTVQFDGKNDAAKDINLGGITGIANTVDFDSCENSGSVQSSATATSKGAINIGGIVGIMNNAVGTIKTCVNDGALTNNTSSSGVLRMGGFVGSILSKQIDVVGSEKVVAFTNNGTITNNGAVSNWTTLGGVVGNIGGLGTLANTVSYCINNGAVLNTKVSNRVSLGGIVGFIQKSGTTVDHNTNTGKVENTGAASTGVTLGGIVGRIEAATDGENTLSYNTNSGDVLFSAASGNDANMLSGVGGILGGHAGNIVSGSGYQNAKLTIDHCTNSGDVKKTGAGETNMYIGGIAGFLNGVANSDKHVSDVTNCTNTADAEVLNGSTGSGEWVTYTGGIVGNFKVKGSLSGCKNSGSVTNTTSSNKSGKFDYVRLGGIVGSAGNGSFVNCTNNGEVKDDSATNAGMVGGIAGCVETCNMTMTNCDNTASVSGKFNSSTNAFPVNMGGVVGYSYKELTLDGCDNSGNITSNRTSGVGIYMGGLVGQMAQSFQLNISSANISGTMMNNTSTNTSKTCMAGLVGLCYGNKITGCHTTMSITNTCSGTNAFVGGLAGQIETGITTEISNCSVNSTIAPGGAGYDGMLVGRLTHKTAKGSKTTVSNVYLQGTFNGTVLKSNDYTGYVYGTQDFGVNAEEVKFGDFQ